MPDTFIPVANPLENYNRHRESITSAFQKVLDGGRYILGEEVSNFEAEFADFHGAGYCVGVANGTEAISLALISCGVGRGDEVITVSHTAVATVAAIELIGAEPVFVDIDPITRCIDHTLIHNQITQRTRAIIPVHMYGQPAPVVEICETAKRHNLYVVEDCAQACGAQISGKMVGTFGDAAAFSFYPTKNLGAVGDGGAVVTSNPEIADHVRWLREYGWKDRFLSKVPGMNSRLDEIQAAVLRVKLPFLLRENAIRRDIAEKYKNIIKNVNMTSPCDISGTVHAMHLYVVECEKRNSLQKFLNEKNIGTALHYPQPVHQQEAYMKRIRGAEHLPVTESLYGRILSLPMYPELSDNDVERICLALGEWY
jgi:dTDP-4-amino-4,6-dideoxygalactose transaminase